jgi:MFS family permease
MAVLLDGFDLVIMGTVLPSLLRYQPWGLNPASATWLVTIGLIGMTIGALLIGYMTDLLGRRTLLIAAVTIFSLLTLACAFAPNPTVFGIIRFFAGIGLGGCLPTAIAMVNEFARGLGRSGRTTTILMTGYHVGAVLTAVLALMFIRTGPDDWRILFVWGAVPALVLVPLMMWKMPESPSWLLTKGRRAEAEAIANANGIPIEPVAVDTEVNPEDKSITWRTLFEPQYLRRTLALAVTSFCGLILVYGLNNWLPTIMREAGYELGAAFTFLLLLNVGAIAGLLIAGYVGDRLNTGVAAVIWFYSAAVLLALLSIKMGQVLLFIVVFIAGIFVFSGQVLVYAFTSANHPAQIRATALGFVAGIGRIGAITGPILGGWVVGAQLTQPWAFYGAALFGVIAGTALVLGGLHRASSHT